MTARAIVLVLAICFGYSVAFNGKAPGSGSMAGIPQIRAVFDEIFDTIHRWK